MPSFLAVGASAAFATLSMAAPAAKLVGRDTIQIKQVAHGTVPKIGPVDMMKTYEKYAKMGAQAPSDVKAAAAAVQSGSVEADPQSYDISYLSPVEVGGQVGVLHKTIRTTRLTTIFRP